MNGTSYQEHDDCSLPSDLRSKNPRGWWRRSSVLCRDDTRIRETEWRYGSSGPLFSNDDMDVVVVVVVVVVVFVVV